MTSIVTFAMNPIAGVGLMYSADRTLVGMHSDVLDFLARFGLIGLGLFLAGGYFWLKEFKARE